jgi:hypothetical protein
MFSEREIEAYVSKKFDQMLEFHLDGTPGAVPLSYPKGNYNLPENLANFYVGRFLRSLPPVRPSHELTPHDIAIIIEARGFLNKRLRLRGIPHVLHQSENIWSEKHELLPAENPRSN